MLTPTRFGEIGEGMKEADVGDFLVIRILGVGLGAWLGYGQPLTPNMFDNISTGNEEGRYEGFLGNMNIRELKDDHKGYYTVDRKGQLPIVAEAMRMFSLNLRGMDMLVKKKALPLLL
ncbi:hypothetical protein V6N12_046406 [Hibiscus sabdariffa]|uniref:Uncharacterized protein n=1 Tax=Hibiscus sabdariffa TaxID=183260 RepID=A0ABR2DIJ8_9ROSI